MTVKCPPRLCGLATFCEESREFIEFTIHVSKAFFGNSPSMFNADRNGLPFAADPLSSSGARSLRRLWSVWKMLNIDLTCHNVRRMNPADDLLICGCGTSSEPLL